MDVANLKIKIITDVDKAIADLNKFKNSVTGIDTSTSSAAGKVSSAFDKMKSAVSGSLQNVQKDVQGSENKLSEFGEHGKKILEGLIEHSTEAGKGFSKMATEIATSGSAIGIGVAAVTVAAIALFKLATATTEAERAQIAMNEALATAVGSVAGEVAELQTLVKIAKDTSLSYDARTQAIKELNKEYPDFNGNITLENINTKIVTTSINNQIEAIKRRSQAKALEKLIDEESIKVEKAKLFNDGIKGSEVLGFTSDIFGSIAKSIGAPGLFGTQTALHDALVEPIIEGQKNIDIYTKKLLELNTEGANSGTLFTGKPDKTPKTRIAKTRVENAFSSASKLLDKEYAEELEATKGAKILIEDVEIKFLARKIALYKNFGKEYASLTKEYLDKVNKIELENAKFKIAQSIALPTTRGLASTTDKLQKGQGAANIAATLNPVLAKLFRDQDEFQAKAKQTAALVQGVLAPAFDAMFTSIIAGGANAGDAFGKALKGIITQLTITLIKTAALAGILSLISGGAGVKGGFSFLEGFKSLLGGGSPFPHAEGGVFTQPTLLGNHLFGEAGKEAIVPLNRFKEFQGGGNQTQVFIPNITLQGNDLVLAFERTQARRGRNG